MTTAETAAVAKASWRFWVVAGLGLLWNGFGGYDYTMSHLQGETYYRQMGMTDAQVAAMDAYPVWMHAVWAIGVWGSVLGAVLLVLRSRWATHAFAASILGALGNLAYSATHGQDAIMPAVIIAICAFFIWYARTMTKRGVLR